MKTEVYSWRVSAELKTELEREAQRRNISLSAVLDLATRGWLANSADPTDTAAEQLRLQKAASKSFGALASGDAHRSEKARQDLRKRLRQRHER